MVHIKGTREQIVLEATEWGENFVGIHGYLTYHLASLMHAVLE